MPHSLVVNKRSRKLYDVSVDRKTKWGNPFKITKNRTREEAIRLYEAYLQQMRPDLIEAAKMELKGKVLACWCAPEPCHADVLARIANEDAQVSIQEQKDGFTGGDQNQPSRPITPPSVSPTSGVHGK